MPVKADIIATQCGIEQYYMLKLGKGHSSVSVHLLYLHELPFDFWNQ